MTTNDILRGELERLFELDEMMTLSEALLGLSPAEVGGTSGKSTYARALVERCAQDDALVALSDAMMFTKKGVKDADLFANAEELAPGTVVGGFKIGKKLGEGGTGVVYQAEKGDEKVALKILKLAHARARAASRRWATAQRAVSSIDDKALGKIVAVGALEDGRPWVATRLVEGQPLAARVTRTGPMHFNEARPIVRGVITALEALHARGLAHGNVKMENVFIVRPSASDKMQNEPTGVLVDPGADRLLVRRAAQSAAESGIVPIAGTPKAFAPEQARSGTASPSSDVYAVGCLLFEILSGKPPFAGAAIDVIAQHLTKEAEAPSTVAPRGWVSKELDAIIQKALAKSPGDRYRTATELREAIESIGRASIPPEARKKASLDQSAFDAAVDALIASPGDETLAAALERIADPAEEWAKAAEKFREVAGFADDTETKKSLLFRAARLFENDAKDDKAADAVYREIIEIDGSDEIARIGHEELKRRSGDAEGLVELLLEKVEREATASDRAAVLREIAETYETGLKDADNAFVAWVQALTEDPKDERTPREIERLAAGKNDRWNEAIASLTEAVNAAEDPAQKVALYVLMGRWYGAHLNRPDFALPCYSQALQIDPVNEGAMDGTVELYRKAQSYPELAGILLRRAEIATNPVRARDFKAEAAEIVHRKLGDASRASDLFEQVLAADPAHPRASDALEGIYAEKKAWPELTKLMEKKAAGQRGAARVDTLSAIAELYEDRLSDADKALVQYEAVLAEDPRNVAALKGLERIYTQKGKYDDLLTNLRAQLETVATPRQRISILERIGGILEEEFVDHKRAAETFEEIVAIEPGHEVANTHLAHLYRQLARFDDLAKTLERHALGSSDEKRKIALLLQSVRVLTVDVGAPARAITMAERVLTVQPDNGDALELLSRLQAQSGDSKSALDSVRKLADAERDPKKKADLYVRAGRMLEETGDKDGAIAQYKSALDADKDNVPAASALRGIYSGRGDAHGAAELLAREIEVTSGAISKAKLFAELGGIRRERLKDVPAAKEAFKKALELDPTSTPAARGLGDIAFDAGDFAEAGKFLEPLLARTSEMTKEDAREVSLRAGDALKKSGAFDKAQRAYLNAKAFAPGDREVLERLAEVTFDSGAADEAAEMYRDILKEGGKDLTGAERGRIVYRVGEALRRSNQLDEARTSLEEAAQLLPGQADPLMSLKQVYEAKSEWEKVVSTLKRRIDVAPDDERVKLLIEQGDVLLGKLSDKARAGKAYVAALELRADDRNLLTKLMAVYSETKDWSKLVEVILRIAELVTDKVQLGKYYNTAAAISHHELGRLDEAADYYEQSLDMLPSLAKAFEGLVSALTQKSDWARLEKAYRDRIKRLEAMKEGEAPPAKDLAHLYDSLGELLKHRLTRPADAVEAFEKAQKLEPENRRRAEQLAEIFSAEPKKFFSSAVRVHQQLLAMSPYRMESYQALRKLYTEAKKPDESWCVCQALTVLKNAEPDEEGFFKKHRRRSPASIKGEMTEELWTKHVQHPDQDPLLSDIFTTITPAVVAVRSQGLAAFKLDMKDKRDAEKDPADMARTLWYAGAATRIALPPIFYKNDDPGGLSFVFSSPPAIALGKGGQAGGPAQALAFVAGRHLSYLRGGLYLRHLVPTGSGLRGWLLAAIKLAVPNFPVPGDLAGEVGEHQAAFKQHLSGPQQDTLRSLVTRLLSAAPELDLKKWTAAVDLTADRVGFLLSNDLEIASALVRASPDEASAVPQKDRLKELTLFSVSESYFALRHKLGIAIGD
jgi:tetratricopeptide (TPR) repeat protein